MHKWPWNREENNQQSNAKPNRQGLEFIKIRLLALCFYRTDSDYNDTNNHHYRMIHRKKADITFMDSLFKIMHKIFHIGTYAIQPKTNKQLGMCKDGRYTPKSIIHWKKSSFLEPSPKGNENSI
jgi:hypothetical protein